MLPPQYQPKQSSSPWILALAVLAVVILVPRLPVRANKTLRASALPAVETPYLLVTFGFAGCGTICPGQLQRLEEVVAQVNSESPRVSAAFVNMNATGASAVTQYVESITDSVIAVRPSAPALKELLLEFGVKYYGDVDSTGAMEHRGDVYLLTRAGNSWRLIQSFPGDSLDTDLALSALNSLTPIPSDS